MNVPLTALVALFVLTFILRLPIAFGMIAGSSLYFLLSGQDIALVAEQILSNLYAKYIILAVPLFVFTAKVMNAGKVTDWVFTFAGSIVGGLRGGIGHVNVVASLIFSGMTGSAVADASGLGIMEIRAI